MVLKLQETNIFLFWTNAYMNIAEICTKFEL